MVASLVVTFEDNDRFTPITRRTTDDLLTSVKGTAYWLEHSTRPSGYYYAEGTQTPVPVEFINDTWYILHYSTAERIFRTRASYRVDPNDPNIGLGHWPDYHTQLPAIQTTTTPVQNPPSNGGMRGVPPTIFDGTRSKADDFWGQFRRFKLVNRTHDAMKVPFDRVLTALTYMRGPLINNWVDQQEKKLAARTDMTKHTHVREDDKTLWSKFETSFLNAWTDTSKKQNAYDQLMRLTMNGWDVDTYIATFDRLTLAAGWDSNSEGTIAKFCEGLSKGVHSKALDRDHIPRTIKEWKVAA